MPSKPKPSANVFLVILQISSLEALIEASSQFITEHLS